MQIYESVGKHSFKNDLIRVMCVILGCARNQKLVAIDHVRNHALVFVIGIAI